MAFDEAQMLTARRIMIVGGPGSGKSTLALALGDRLGLPVFHIDHLIWGPNWTERDLKARTKEALEIETQNAWIFEGGGAATFDNRLERADVLRAEGNALMKKASTKGLRLTSLAEINALVKRVEPALPV